MNGGAPRVPAMGASLVGAGLVALATAVVTLACSRTNDAVAPVQANDDASAPANDGGVAVADAAHDRDAKSDACGWWCYDASGGGDASPGDGAPHHPDWVLIDGGNECFGDAGPPGPWPKLWDVTCCNGVVCNGDCASYQGGSPQCICMGPILGGCPPTQVCCGYLGGCTTADICAANPPGH